MPPIRLFARFLPVAALVTVVTASAQAPAAAPKPEPCTAPEHRQFDFWIGEWDVHDPAGKKVGENRISAIHKGCALLEEWRGAGGFSGTSLNLYDASRRRWHQSWVDSRGGLLLLEGGFADGAMTLSGDTADAVPPATRVRQRIRWQAQPDGRVRQLWESSNDDGLHWSVVFDGWYTRRR